MLINLNLLICIQTECCFKRACFFCGYLRSVLLRAWPNRTNGIDVPVDDVRSEACILYELKEGAESETKVVTRYFKFMAPADCKEGTAPVKNIFVKKDCVAGSGSEPSATLHEWLSHVTLLSSPQALKLKKCEMSSLMSFTQEELRSCFHKCPNWNCSWFYWEHRSH